MLYYLLFSNPTNLLYNKKKITLASPVNGTMKDEDDVEHLLMSQMDLSRNHLYSIRPPAKTKKEFRKRQLHKKCKPEFTMNAILWLLGIK